MKNGRETVTSMCDVAKCKLRAWRRHLHSLQQSELSVLPQHYSRLCDRPHYVRWLSSFVYIRARNGASYTSGIKNGSSFFILQDMDENFKCKKE